MRFVISVLVLALSHLNLLAQDTNLFQVLLDGEDWTPFSTPAPAVATRTTNGWTFSLAEQAVWVVGPDNQKRQAAGGIGSPGALSLSPDGGTLVVADAAGKHLYAFRVEKDGSLTCREAYGTMLLPFGAKASGAAGMTVDSAGRFYVSTPVGIQMFDGTCRLVGIIRSPTAQPGPLAMMGNELYASDGKRWFVRKTKAQAP
jgi:sugar lactone lactonase YvrE